jgi:hypothetical protein
MTEANTIENDPMGQSCDDIDISYPLLPASNYPMVIKEAKRGPNKAGDGENIELKWANVNAGTSTKGEPVSAGQIVLTSYIGLTPKPERKDESTGRTIRARTNIDIAKDITKVVKAVKMTKTTPGAIAADCFILIGKEAIVKIGIRNETANFPESNEIKSFVIGE